MRFRLGVLVGFGTGYVLGAQAGRARYEQIQQAWGKLMGTPQAQQIAEDVKVAATKASDSLEQKANESVAKVTELVRGSSDQADDGSSTSPKTGTTPATPITPPRTGTTGTGTGTSGTRPGGTGTSGTGSGGTGTDTGPYGI